MRLPSPGPQPCAGATIIVDNECACLCHAEDFGPGSSGPDHPERPPQDRFADCDRLCRQGKYFALSLAEGLSTEAARAQVERHRPRVVLTNPA